MVEFKWKEKPIRRTIIECSNFGRCFYNLDLFINNNKLI